MKQIIRFTDVNVDGCGTNIEVYVQVEGNSELTIGVIERTYEAIEKYKEESEYEYDTDSIVDVACRHLEAEGYMCCSVIPEYDIEF